MYFKLQSVPLCPAHLLTFIEPPPVHASPWKALAVHTLALPAATDAFSASLGACVRCLELFLAQVVVWVGQSFVQIAHGPLVVGVSCPLHGWVPRKELERLRYERVLGKDIASATWFHTCLLVSGISEMGVWLSQPLWVTKVSFLY